jgi:hypothetical protein
MARLKEQMQLTQEDKIESDNVEQKPWGVAHFCIDSFVTRYKFCTF